jgi:hypothetical protein
MQIKIWEGTFEDEPTFVCQTTWDKQRKLLVDCCEPEEIAEIEKKLNAGETYRLFGGVGTWHDIEPIMIHVVIDMVYGNEGNPGVRLFLNEADAIAMEKRLEAEEEGNSEYLVVREKAVLQ